MSEPLYAGFGKVDITPDPGDPPAFHVFDPLFFRALHLRQGERQVTFLAADLFLLGDEFYQDLKSRVKDLGVDGDWILGGASHIGTCPILFHDYVYQPNPALRRFDAQPEFARAAAEAIRQAVDDASEARTAVGTAQMSEALGFHRRAHDEAGNFVFLSLAKYREAPADLVYQPCDRQFGVVYFERDHKRPIALTNFGMHALTHYDDLGHISGDYPGRLCQMLDSEGVDALFFPGALGDVSPARIGSDPTDYTARGLTNTTRQMLDSLPLTASTPLYLAEKRVDLPLRPLPEQAVKEQAELEQEAAAITEGTRRYETWRAQRFAGQSSYASRMRAVVIGSTALLHLQGEPFSETGHAIRASAPFENVFLLADPCPEVGYIATPLAHREGGTEPTLTTLREDAEPLVRQAAIAFLQEVAAATQGHPTKESV